MPCDSLKFCVSRNSFDALNKLLTTLLTTETAPATLHCRCPHMYIVNNLYKVKCSNNASCSVAFKSVFEKINKNTV